MIPDRAPTSVWCLSRANFGTYVQTDEGDRINIVSPDPFGTPALLCVSRKDARLLAKRINECLDATVKR